jgi:hypothetical protein
MVIDLNKFWEYVKDWSVGRMAVLLILIGEIWCKLSKNTDILPVNWIIKIYVIGVLLEIFELSHNKIIVQVGTKCISYFVFGAVMLASVAAIIILPFLQILC